MPLVRGGKPSGIGYPPTKNPSCLVFVGRNDFYMRQELHYVLNEQILSPTDPLVEVWRAKGHKLVNIWCREPIELPCESPGLPVPQHENRCIREERVCSSTIPPFGAEGWRHCVAAISNFVGGTVLPPSHPAISQAQTILAPTCKAVHT